MRLKNCLGVWRRARIHVHDAPVGLAVGEPSLDQGANQLVRNQPFVQDCPRARHNLTLDRGVGGPPAYPKSNVAVGKILFGGPSLHHALLGQLSVLCTKQFSADYTMIETGPTEQHFAQMQPLGLCFDGERRVWWAQSPSARTHTFSERESANMKRASVASAELNPRYLPLQLRSTWCQKQTLRAGDPGDNRKPRSCLHLPQTRGPGALRFMYGAKNSSRVNQPKSTTWQY